MSTEDNNQVDAASSENNAGAGSQPEATSISLSKEEYDALMSDRASLGSLKREFKDFKKSIETKPTPQEPTPSDNGLLQKSFLRAAGITHAEDVELALSTAKKWGVEVDQLVDDEDFKAKLEKAQTKRANELATSNVRGSTGSSSQKNTPEYWIGKGQPPTRADVPDRQMRAKIARAMMASTKNDKKFYND